MLRRERFVALVLSGAVLLGSGSVLTASNGGASGSTFVPLTSCRLLDTRPAPDNVGPRATPLAADDTLVASVRGTNGNCTIPTEATAVSMNVTIVGPTSTSYLTVFPSDASPRPLVSSLNWVAGQAPTANAVTSRLSADGQLSFYNLSGRVDLLADIVGYYVPSGASVDGDSGAPGPAGPTGPTGPVGAKGPQGAPARPPQVLHVATSGGDYTLLSEALLAIGDTRPAATATDPYRIEIGPGVYEEGDTIMLTSNVEIVGSGIGVTVIECRCSSQYGTGGRSMYGPAISNVAVRDLTLVPIGDFVNRGIEVVASDHSDPVVLDHVAVESVGAHAPIALVVFDAAVDATGLVIDATDGNGTAIDLRGGSSFRLRDGNAVAGNVALDNRYAVADVADSSLEASTAVSTDAFATSFITRTAVVGTTDGSNHCVDVWDASYASRTCT